MIGRPILRGAEPFGDIQAEVVPALRETLAGVCEVYDEVPNDAPAPYVIWNTAWSAERDSLNGTADRVWFQIDVWSDYRGYLEAARISEIVVARLHHALIYVAGFSPIHVLREQAHETRDPGGRHRRLALTFNCPYVSSVPPEEG